jgi:hypothetical protein
MSEPGTTALVPDDDDFWGLLARGEEPLLLQLAIAEDAERDSDRPYQLPAPLADRAALEAYHRVQDALSRQRHQPRGRQLVPDGRYEHLPLLPVELPVEDLGTGRAPPPLLGWGCGSRPARRRGATGPAGGSPACRS